MLDVRQREILARVNAGGEGAILISEVAPVITLGRRGHSDTLDPALSPEILPTDRGGLATWHGPGQIVLFAVDHLERLTGDPRGVRKAVLELLDVARQVALKYDPTVECRDGAMAGLWCARGKLASVGVHIENRVLLHGLSLNVLRTPESFRGLSRPCGLDAQVAYLAEAPDFPTISDPWQAIADQLVSQAVLAFGS